MADKTKTVPKPNGVRRPIPVEKMTFHALQSVNIPGKKQATSCKRTTAAHKRYELEYHPWLRSFKVTYTSGPGMDPKSVFVGEYQVMTWQPCEGAPTS